MQEPQQRQQQQQKEQRQGHKYHYYLMIKLSEIGTIYKKQNFWNFYLNKIILTDSIMLI